MTNLKMADAAIAAYSDTTDDTVRAQLAFFRAVWEGQACLSAVLASDYDIPDSEHLKRLASEEVAVLVDRPADLDGRALTEAAGRMAAVMCEKGGFSEEACDALQDVNWASVCGPAAAVAGKYPEAYVDSAYAVLRQAELPDDALQAAASAVSLGLRALLDPIAEGVMRARSAAGLEEAHPVKCPVCGCASTLAIVGASSETAGGKRELWCGQCGARWAYDRVRCARCGTRNQGHLHYYHIDGDDNHRLQTCDECGGYTRTVFQEDLLMPVCPDVEDVVMVKLDAVAAQHIGS